MPIRFGYWMPLGSGGFVISNIEQRTDWSLDYNSRLARTAEELGFDYGLAPADLSPVMDGSCSRRQSLVRLLSLRTPSVSS